MWTFCNKKVHISCLDTWYNNNGNKNKLCFLCTKESNDLESIIVRSPIIETNNRTVNSQSNYKYTFCLFIFLLFSLFVFIFINTKVFE